MIRALALIAALALPLCAGALAQTPPAWRIVSINLCTDQLLLALARPEQVTGLSPFARDRTQSFLAARAEALPVLSGTAEDIIVLKPDLVVAGRFDRSATRALVRRQGIVLEEFDVVDSVAEAKRQILRFGEIIGETARAARLAGEIDTALTELKAAAAASPLTVLPLSRRGWTPGRRTLVGDLLVQAGLANAAEGAGYGGFASLEAIVRLRPDAVLLSRDSPTAEDQGSAMLLHPALARLFPPERRIILPERLTVCGGPELAEAMRLLAGQIAGLKPRVGGRDP